MVERPILFSAPMVRALLAGTKTQTRRVMARQKQHDFTQYTLFGQQGYSTDDWVAIEHAPDWPDGKDDQCRCPYARRRGDRLWVREAFIHEPADYCWDASVSIPCRPASTVYRADVVGDSAGAGWKPSIHMPRRLSRIDLEVTALRVQRLQEISEEDAIAEGVQQWRIEGGAQSVPHGYSERDYYRLLWESINGSGSWALNPWVWAVSFKRIKPEAS